MPIPVLAGLALGIGGAVGKMFGRGKANRKMDELLSQDPSYSANPIANERLSLAKTLLNARMPGASSVERNLLASQQNRFENINRNATSGAQAIAAANMVSGQTDRSLMNLGVEEAQDYQRRYGNLVNAQEGVIREGDKVYDDTLRRYGNRFQVNAAQNENRQNTWGDISNLGFGVANFGLAGGFDNMFGGGRQTQSAPGISQRSRIASMQAGRPQSVLRRFQQ
jgi:hypothetical protein